MVKIIHGTLTGLFRHSGCCLLLLAILALPILPATADNKEPPFDPHLLRPADTSSPRDTLLTFDNSVEEALRAFQADVSSEAITSAGKRARETFDISELPDRGRRAKEFETVLLLKEILDRTELPPYHEIPGDEALVDKEKPLAHWTIPDIRITISQFKEGPRTRAVLPGSAPSMRASQYRPWPGGDLCVRISV